MGTFATTTAIAIKMIGTDFDTATTALASAMIDGAENEVKKYLSKTYDLTTPTFNTTTSIPPMVRTLTEDYAVGLMYENMARGSKEGYYRSDRLLKRVTDNLMMLQDGSLQLTDTSGALIPTSGTQWQVKASNKDYPTTFNEDDPKKWKVSRKKLDDISDERDE